MTKFSDQLFDDLMEEHGHALAGIRRPATPKRHLAARPVLLTAGAGGIAAVAAVGTLVAGGATPAYAVTTHPDGTVSLAVYQRDGIAQANSRLRQIGDGRVVIVPVGSGCPGISSLPGPSKPSKGQVSLQGSVSADGAMTVNARGVPAGETLVVGFQVSTSRDGKVRVVGMGAQLTTGPVPKCLSVPAAPLPGKFGSPVHQSGGSGSKPGDGGPGNVTRTAPGGATAPRLS